MTPYGMGLEPPRKARYQIDEANWRSLLGKRSSFSAYCDFFRQQIREQGREQVLASYLPELIDGWVGSLTHGTIHLGWALLAEHEGMIVEGLAYMAYSYVPCHHRRSRLRPASWGANGLRLGVTFGELLAATAGRDAGLAERSD